MPEQDIIYVRQLELETVVGFHEWEQALAQLVHVELEIFTDTRAAASSNSVGDTFDYEQIIKRLRRLAADERHRLVEALAERIADVVMTEFAVKHIRVRVAKPHAVSGTRDVGVVIERGADDAAHSATDDTVDDTAARPS